jgi:glycolate oxidase
VSLLADLGRAVGADHLITDPVALRTYQSDGLTGYRAQPLAVALPGSTAEVVAAVSACDRHGVPFVARGAGTGLSGGAVPVAEGIVIGLSRMRAILNVDVPNRRVRLQPGVTNLEVTQAVAPHGLYYAPDPSSQQVCTIGGNVAENSGGAHCLKHGFTTNHVIEADVVLADGELVRLGEGDALDLLGAVVGSEGTLGIVTKALVRLTRQPEAVRVLLAQFDSVVEASNTVSAVIAQGIVPAAMEMMDRLVCQAVEAAYHVGFPPDVGAVLLIEVDGLGEGLDLAIERIAVICHENAARSVRVAASAEERAALWNARKMAFGAMGRLAPSYYMQDGVVPRTKLPATLARVEAVSREYDLRIANVFHAGDGNLHPLILFDRREPGVVERVLRAGVEILQTCIDMGGTISGEHGIGLEKKEQMALIFTADDLAAMARLKASFNPRDLFNPDKIFPSRVSCAEVREVRQDSRHAALLAEYGH